MSASRFYLWSLSAIALLVALSTVVQGAVPQTFYAYDSAILYDAGWRAFCGLRPHADFYSSLGPVTYLFVGTGFWLFGLTPHVIAYMNAIVFCILIAVTWYLLRDRISPFWLFWVALLIAICCIAPHSLRHAPKGDTSYVALYNRQGYALIMLLCMLLFSPVVAAVSALRWKLTSLAIGCIISIALFLKVSLFPIALLVLALGHADGCRKWFSYTWCSIAFAVLTLFFLAYIRFDVVAMLSDLAITGKAKTHYLESYPHQPLRTFLQMIVWLHVCLGVFVIGLVALFRQKVVMFGYKEAWHESIVFIGLNVISVMMISANGLYGNFEDFPLLVLIVALMCIRFAHKSEAAEDWIKQPTSFRLLYFSAAVFVISYASTETNISVDYPTHSNAGNIAFDMPQLKGINFNRDHPVEPIVKNVEDGIRLLNKHNAIARPFTVFDFASYMHYASGTIPCGGSPFIDGATNLAGDSHPTPEKYINNASYILVSKVTPSPMTLNALKGCYGDYIDRHYKVLDESERWVMYERLPAAQVVAP